MKSTFILLSLLIVSVYSEDLGEILKLPNLDNFFMETRKYESTETFFSDTIPSDYKEYLNKYTISLVITDLKIPMGTNCVQNFLERNNLSFEQKIVDAIEDGQYSKEDSKCKGNNFAFNNEIVDWTKFFVISKRIEADLFARIVQTEVKFQLLPKEVTITVCKKTFFGKKCHDETITVPRDLTAELVNKIEEFSNQKEIDYYLQTLDQFPEYA